MDEHCHPGTHWFSFRADSDKHTMCLIPSRLVFYGCVKFLSPGEKMQFAWSTCRTKYWNFCSLVFVGLYTMIITKSGILMCLAGSLEAGIYLYYHSLGNCKSTSLSTIKQYSFPIPNAASHYKIVCQLVSPASEAMLPIRIRPSMCSVLNFPNSWTTMKIDDQNPEK